MSLRESRSRNGNDPATAPTVQGQTKGNPKVKQKMRQDIPKVNALRSVGAGVVMVGSSELEADVLSDGSRMLRLKRISETFGGSADSRDSARHLQRIAGNSQAETVQPRKYIIPGGGFAQGLTSEQFTKLLTVYVDRALAGKLHPKQLAALPTVRAMEKALIATAIDELIDAACGVVRTNAERAERAAEHFATQTAITSASDLPVLYQARWTEIKEQVEITARFAAARIPGIDITRWTGHILQYALGHANVGGAGREYGYWDEQTYLAIRQSVIAQRGFFQMLTNSGVKFAKPRRQRRLAPLDRGQRPLFDACFTIAGVQFDVTATKLEAA